MNIDRLLSMLTHVFHGILAGIFWFIDYKLSVFLFVQFFLYEYVEEEKIKDEMFYELREWSGGFAVGLAISILRFSLSL